MLSLSARVSSLCGGEFDHGRSGVSSSSLASLANGGHRFASWFLLALGVFGLLSSHSGSSGGGGSLVGVVVAPRSALVDEIYLGRASLGVSGRQYCESATL